MGTYAITGAASGMGRETANRLRGDGHAVIGVDLKDADIVADLSTPRGRQEAADGVLEASGGRLDVFHAVGFRRLPLRQRSLRGRRHRCAFPRRRLAEAGPGTSPTRLSASVQELAPQRE